MKKIFISIIFAFEVHGSVNNCNPLPPDSTDQLDVRIAIPNCVRPRALAQARDQGRNSKPICDCKSEFEQNSMLPPSTPVSKLQKQEMFLEAMLKEYEKVQVDHLVELARLSSIDKMGKLQFQRSIAACQFKTKESFLVGCESKTAKDLLQRSPIFTRYQDRVANEFLNILSPIQENPRPGLLNRASLLSNYKIQQCQISEFDTMKYTSQALEDLIAPNLLVQIKQQAQLYPSKSITNILETIGADSGIENLLRRHPMIRLHMRSTEQFANFINSVPAPYSKENLSQTLLNPQNSTLLDTKLADSCGSSFTKLKTSLCSEKFEAGDLELDPFANLDKLGVTIPGSLPKIAASPELIALNEQVLRFCPGTIIPTAQSLTDASKPIEALLGEEYVGMSSEQFSVMKFNREITSPRDQICAMKDGTKPCASYSELIKQHSCLAAQLWRESQANQIPTSPLLAQRPIAQLIRGFLPPAESLDAKTKTELIRIGIIPLPSTERPSPAQVAQAAAQVERFNPNFTSPANATLPRSQAPNVIPSPSSTLADKTRVNAVNPNIPQASGYSQQLAEIMKQKQQMFEDSNETYRDVIDQLIKRKIDNPNQAEITKAVTQEFERKSKPFDPQSREGQSFINNIVNNYPRAVATNNPEVIAAPFEQERVQEILKEAIKTTQTNAQTSGLGRIPAGDVNSIAASARLTSTPTTNGVEKIVVTDPKLKLDDPTLPQILQSVLTVNENGEVLQSMLDQRKDFILKLNSTEVMMDFDPEAQNYRIRPLGDVPDQVLAHLNRFLNEYSVIARVKKNRHQTLSKLLQELQQSQSSLQ